jgi:anti-anti-sigma factor
VDLEISIRESGDVTILDLRGKATLGAEGDLLNGHLQRLVANGVQKLLVNLADVTQLDSSGISAITGTHVSLSRQGGSLKLLCPSGRVRAVLRVIRLPDIRPLRMRPKRWPAFDRRVTLLGPEVVIGFDLAKLEKLLFLVETSSVFASDSLSNESGHAA